MNCAEAKPLLSLYLDAAMTGKQMHSMGEHLRSCTACRSDMEQLGAAQRLVSQLGRIQPPPELALRLRVELSRRMAEKRRNPLQTLALHWNNAVKAFMVPATAGMITSVIIFGLLIGMLMPVQLSASNDVPTGLYTPPELTRSPFTLSVGQASDAIVVEAYIDASGRVQDFHVISAPEDAQEIMPELKNMLLFTQFRPATSFGLPTSGRAILTFTGINVRG